MRVVPGCRSTFESGWLMFSFHHCLSVDVSGIGLLVSPAVPPRSNTSEDLIKPSSLLAHTLCDSAGGGALPPESLRRPDGGKRVISREPWVREAVLVRRWLLTAWRSRVFDLRGTAELALSRLAEKHRRVRMAHAVHGMNQIGWQYSDHSRTDRSWV